MEAENNVNSVANDNAVEEIRNLTVIQDFNNKKANSHATIFVASVFALFTVLSLSVRIVTQATYTSPNITILILSSVSYWLIWVFGIYSALNFTYYSTISQRAEESIVRGMDRRLITSYLTDWNGPSRIFARFKVNPNGQGWFRRNFESFILIGFLIIGFMPFLAFIIWFLN